MNTTKKPTIRTPQQKRSIETRQRILNAALNLFSEKGFYATNSKEIAAAAGVSIGSFYSYFEEKEPLFLEILTNYSQLVTNKISSCMKEMNKEQDVHKIVPVFINTLLAAHNFSPKFHRESLALLYSHPKVQTIFKQEEELIIKYIISFLKSYSAQIKIKDIKTAAILIRHSTEAVIHSVKIFGLPCDESQLISELTKMLSAYLFYE